MYKSSVLAFVFHGFEGREDVLKTVEPERPEDFEHVAEGLHVRFGRNAEDELKLLEVVR